MWKKLLVSVMAMSMMMMGASAMAAGTLTMTGSTSVYPLATQLADQYNAKHAGAKLIFTINQNDSQGGINAAEAGTVDIGNASRDKKSSDPSDLVFTTIAKDAVTVIVNADSPVANLSQQQLIDIFTGKTTDWSAISDSGKSGTINVYTRENGSGTLSFFTGTLLNGASVTTSATVKTSSEALRDAVATDANGIGFVGMSYVNSQVTGYALNGVEATVANVQNNSYIGSRNFNMVTKNAPTGNAKLFIDWILSSAGQNYVAQDGEVPLTATTNAAKAASVHRSHHVSHHTSH